MNPLLTIVIAALNEKPSDLHHTVKSIRESTGGQWVQVLIVDDASTVPVCCLPVTIMRNRIRVGVGLSRHLGVEAALAPYVLICDGHCVFSGDWLQPLLDTLRGSDKLLLCGQCWALSEDGTRHTGTYNGARMVIHDPNETNIRWRVLTAKWAKDKPGQSFYPLSAVMGACYAMSRDFFLKIGGLKMLREFGGDEENLSLKTILAGGEIRMFKQLKIGHKFRETTKVPYRITVESCIYNVCVNALTCCPPEVARDLIEKIGPGREWMDAKEMVRQNKDAIEAERVRLQGVFTRSWDEYLTIIKQIDG